MRVRWSWSWSKLTAVAVAAWQWQCMAGNGLMDMASQRLAWPASKHKQQAATRQQQQQPATADNRQQTTRPTSNKARNKAKQANLKLSDSKPRGAKTKFGQHHLKCHTSAKPRSNKNVTSTPKCKTYLPFGHPLHSRPYKLTNRRWCDSDARKWCM